MRDTLREVPAARASPTRVVFGKGSGLPSVVEAAEALETKSPLPFEEVARIVAELLGAWAAEPVA